MSLRSLPFLQVKTGGEFLGTLEEPSIFQAAWHSRSGSNSNQVTSDKSLNHMNVSYCHEETPSCGFGGLGNPTVAALPSLPPAPSHLKWQQRQVGFQLICSQQPQARSQICHCPSVRMPWALLPHPPLSWGHSVSLTHLCLISSCSLLMAGLEMWGAWVRKVELCFSCRLPQLTGRRPLGTGSLVGWTVVCPLSLTLLVSLSLVSQASDTSNNAHLQPHPYLGGQKSPWAELWVWSLRP